jgi:hypothetical protein
VKHSGVKSQSNRYLKVSEKNDDPSKVLAVVRYVVLFEYCATDTRLHGEEAIYEHREEGINSELHKDWFFPVLQQQILLHPELKFWELLEPLKLLECLPGARSSLLKFTQAYYQVCEFHFSDAYNDVQVEIWDRMYQSVKKALEILVEVDTNSLARRILSDQVLKVIENNYIPFLEIDDFDDADRESLKDMVLPGESACKGMSR